MLNLQSFSHLLSLQLLTLTHTCRQDTYTLQCIEYKKSTALFFTDQSPVIYKCMSWHIWDSFCFTVAISYFINLTNFELETLVLHFFIYDLHLDSIIWNAYSILSTQTYVSYTFICLHISCKYISKKNIHKNMSKQKSYPSF